MSQEYAGDLPISVNLIGCTATEPVNLRHLIGLASVVRIPHMELYLTYPYKTQIKEIWSQLVWIISVFGLTLFKVLSNSVAVAMRMMISEGKLLQEAVFTGKLISIFDKLFDTFNSSSRYDAKATKSAMTKTSKHWTFLQDTAM